MQLDRYFGQIKNKTMKNLKTYENWLSENSITTIGDKIQFAGKSVKIKRVGDL